MGREKADLQELLLEPDQLPALLQLGVQPGPDPVLVGACGPNTA